jgi:hypothetical protein
VCTIIEEIAMMEIRARGRFDDLRRHVEPQVDHFNHLRAQAADHDPLAQGVQVAERVPDDDASAGLRRDGEPGQHLVGDGVRDLRRDEVLRDARVPAHRHAGDHAVHGGQHDFEDDGLGGNAPGDGIVDDLQGPVAVRVDEGFVVLRDQLGQHARATPSMTVESDCRLHESRRRIGAARGESRSRLRIGRQAGNAVEINPGGIFRTTARGQRITLSVGNCAH